MWFLWSKGRCLKDVQNIEIASGIDNSSSKDSIQFGYFYKLKDNHKTWISNEFKRLSLYSSTFLDVIIE
jgi:hypothetical protein